MQTDIQNTDPIPNADHIGAALDAFEQAMSLRVRYLAAKSELEVLRKEYEDAVALVRTLANEAAEHEQAAA